MDRMKAILLMAATLLFATSPLYSGDFGGFAPEQFPNPQVDPPVVPAGYAFSIWGLIYIYLIVHAGFGLLKRDTNPVWDAVRWPLIVSLTVGASWIPVAKISPLWATVLIWIMLLSALGALLRSTGRQDTWLLQTPLAIYAGWLTAASCVSIGLIGAGYGVLTDQIGWAWLALLGALVLAGSVQFALSRAPEYGFTVCWALIAISVRNWDLQTHLAMSALAGAVVICLLALWARHRSLSSTSV